MYKCPYCGSARLFRYQRDSDYSGGAFYNPLNETKLGIYEKPDLDDPAPPDIDICYCLDCMMFTDFIKILDN